MTRFVGESLSTRPGRSSKALLGKDRDKAMKEFLETGKHPIIEKTVQENASSALQPLPTLDINRPHIFLDLQQQGKPLRRIIVELFEDLFPVVGAAFRHRCMEGHHTLKGTSIHKVQPHFAIFGGLGAAGTGTELPPRSAAQRKIQHTDGGLLSVSADGTHFAITIARALALDGGYRVIGRVGKGSEFLDQFNDMLTGLQDEPEQPITIAQCGTTDHRGRNESLSQARDGGASTSDAAAVTRGNVAEASAGVLDALAQGLKRKPSAAGAAPEAKKRRKGMGMLAEEEDDDDDDDDGSDDDQGAADVV